MLPFSMFRAAVFAEPSVTKIEEVIGLIHGTAADYQAPVHLLTDVRHLPATFLSILEKPPSCRGPRLNALAPR
ncbi:MAG: hypothetical protein LC776_09685, partial [Acidobacteria bacterium]|nr:hypothetical protein [Acidobacteriota bacterium]